MFRIYIDKNITYGYNCYINESGSSVMVMEKLLKMNGSPCGCGKKHEFNSEIIVGHGAINKVVGVIKKLGCKKPYVLSDKNTFMAGARKVLNLLDNAGIKYQSFSFDEDKLEPDEKTVGSAFMHLSKDCDMIIGVGSGVINDTAKLLSMHSGLKYVIVATAPSMDGYASMTSSMTRDGLKISLPSRCADVIIGDNDILESAPKKMLLAGIGDMLAKYVSICEWRIANLICGEYYCEEIAELIRLAVGRIVQSVDNLSSGKTEVVSAVFDGLTAGSVAMNYAGISRPASGVEHYMSHLWDMRGAEFGEKVELHGLQCAVGTFKAIKLYEKLKTIIPNKEKAKHYVNNFNYERWSAVLTEFLGTSAKNMIALEKNEGKYDLDKHAKRLEVIVNKWDEIIKIINEELPAIGEIEKFYDKLGLPKTMKDIGLDEELLSITFKCTKDIRDKYVLSRLCWDLGIIDEMV